MKLVVVGAGAVGGPLAAWFVERGDEVAVMARTATAHRLEREGIAYFVSDEGGALHRARPRVVRSLAEESPPDFVVVGVKARALGEVLDAVEAAFGRDVAVVSLLNGITPHRELPARFPRAIAALVHFNAWTEESGVHGLVSRGAIVVAPMVPGAAADAKRFAAALEGLVPAVYTDRGRDAALGKMVLNLSGSLQALTAFHRIPPDDADALQRLLTGLVAEGLEVVRAAGAREVRVPGTPPYVLLDAAARLPLFLTRRMFRKNLARMRVASLAQDVDRGIKDLELDGIHGELLRMADGSGLGVPILRTVYDELVRRLSLPTFEPLAVSVLERLVRARPC